MRAFREETIRELLVNNKNVENLADAIVKFNFEAEIKVI